MIVPSKLKKGDEIRIVSPAQSLSIISEDNRSVAIKRLNQLGLKVSFSKHAEESDEFLSSSVKSRIDDIHEAFKDKNVKAVLATIGGFNSNQLLRYIDYSLIKRNPKIFCGYSDITAIANAIMKKTEIITYSGPGFSNFGMKKGFEQTLNYFKKCLFQKESFEVIPSEKWSNDKWYLDQENRKFIKNKGCWVINEGKAEGKIIGGNLCTLNLLQGTEFMPSLQDSILFIEDDYESNANNFDMDLQSLIHQPEFKGVKGIVIGRFEKASEVTKELITKIIKTKRELNNIPVIANADFGHTTPLITFPIGGKASLKVHKSKVKLKIIEH